MSATPTPDFEFGDTVPAVEVRSSHAKTQTCRHVGTCVYVGNTRYLYGVPDDIQPIRNLPAGSTAKAHYSNSEFAYAIVKVRGRTEKWILGTRDGETVLELKQWEEIERGNAYALTQCVAGIVYPLYLLLYPLIKALQFLHDDWQDYRDELDNYTR
jgi:hypothetical protein